MIRLVHAGDSGDSKALNSTKRPDILVETRRELKCEGYIRLIFHALDLFSFCLKVLGDMSEIGPESKEPRMFRMSCLVIDDSCTRM